MNANIPGAIGGLAEVMDICPMRIPGCIAALFLLLFVHPHAAVAREKQHRILFILDASATMSGTWRGMDSKYGFAAMLITSLAREINARNGDIAIGLRAYGQCFPASYGICKDTRSEVYFSKDNLTQLALRLNDLQPSGNGSPAYAFSQAARNELADRGRYLYSIIVLADTGRGCRQNNCIGGNASWPEGFYRKYLIEFGSTGAAGCYDSVFSADIPLAASAIVYIAAQFPEKQREAAGTSFAHAASIAPSTPPQSDTANYGWANITNTNGRYTIVLYKEENGKFIQFDEIFFSGAPNKIVKLKPGRYKAAYEVNDREISKIFTVERGKVVDISVK